MAQVQGPNGAVWEMDIIPNVQRRIDAGELSVMDTPKPAPAKAETDGEVPVTRAPAKRAPRKRAPKKASD